MKPAACVLLSFGFLLLLIVSSDAQYPAAKHHSVGQKGPPIKARVHGYMVTYDGRGYRCAPTSKPWLAFQWLKFYRTIGGTAELQPKEGYYCVRFRVRKGWRAFDSLSAASAFVVKAGSHGLNAAVEKRFPPATAIPRRRR